MTAAEAQKLEEAMKSRGLEKKHAQLWSLIKRLSQKIAEKERISREDEMAADEMPGQQQQQQQQQPLSGFDAVVPRFGFLLDRTSMNQACFVSLLAEISCSGGALWDKTRSF